jgi:hypothetical protein
MVLVDVSNDNFGAYMIVDYDSFKHIKSQVRSTRQIQDTLTLAGKTQSSGSSKTLYVYNLWQYNSILDLYLWHIVHAAQFCTCPPPVTNATTLDSDIAQNQDK